MDKLIQQFEAAEAPASDEGVVTIEYVLVAVAVAAGVAIVFATGLWDKLNTTLTDLLP